MQSVASLEHALQLAACEGAGEPCVIGGGEVYALALPLADRLHLTWVDTVVDDADAFFPPVDPARWRELHSEHHPADARRMGSCSRSTSWMGGRGARVGGQDPLSVRSGHRRINENRLSVPVS